MEYYAKSKEKVLTEQEMQKVKKAFERVISMLEGELTEVEREVLDNSLNNLQQKEKQPQKTLRDHIKETVLCAKDFFEQYGDYFTEKQKKLILFACEYHDYGKADILFQNRIQKLNLGKELEKEIRNITMIPHGHLSTCVISKEKIEEKIGEIKKEDFKVLCTAVYHHHDREDDVDDNKFKIYIEKYYKPYIKEFLNMELKTSLRNRSNTLFANNSIGQTKRIEDKAWYQYLTIKGMLNKFDWTVSAGFESAEEFCDRKEKQLKKSIDERLHNQYRPMQIYMKENKNQNLVIIAPTGSGKTEGSLLWLNGEKGFYTLPLRVSSNAIYKRIKEQYHYEHVALLHSSSLNTYIEEAKEESGLVNYERAKLLSYPLTICTVDQLFLFAYKALGTEIFPATLKYSKIILDEIQAYSPRVVATLIYCLKTISKMGGKFAIVTATFPPVLKAFMRKKGLVEDKNYLFQDFTNEDQTKRHMLEIRNEEFDIEELAEKSQEKKVLVICNTIKKAQQLYEQLSEQIEEVFLLHSNFLRQDRELLEKSIIQFAKEKNKKGIWISTQIVEASLDIDFEILYTEMSTADSLLQRMGRCNRKGKYEPETSNIIVFDTKNGRNIIYDKDIYDRSIALLKKYENKIFTESEKTNYINDVYKEEEIKNSIYYKEIEDNLNKLSDIKVTNYDKKKAQEEFRDIRSIAVIPYETYEKKETLFQEGVQFIKSPNIGKEARQIIREKFLDYTINQTIYYRTPDNIDKSTIKGTNIHKIYAEYDFDKDTKKGRGLVIQKEEYNYL